MNWLFSRYAHKTSPIDLWEQGMHPSNHGPGNVGDSSITTSIQNLHKLPCHMEESTTIQCQSGIYLHHSQIAAIWKHIIKRVIQPTLCLYSHVIQLNLHVSFNI